LNENINKLIKKIQEIRNSKLLVYITGDRRKFETKIGMDVFPIINEHLSKLGKIEKLDLFLYSTGGVTMAGFGLVNLFREHCEKFCVFIPFKAYSCATLICLGADEIIMSKLGQLSPIDPSITHPLGPYIQNPQNPQIKKLVPISVEDVTAYLNLAKESGLKGEESLQIVFEKLTESVHPLALGAVHRTKEENEFLADYLLSYHIKSKESREKIINPLIRERFSHNYLISRNEAKNLLNLNINETDPELEKLIMELFDEYSKVLYLNQEFSEEIFLGESNEKVGTFDRAIIQSENLTHSFQTECNVTRQKIQMPSIQIPGIQIPHVGYAILILRQEWTKI